MKLKWLLFFGIMAVLFVILAVSFFSINYYNEKWIIGKTSTEIIEKYGEFDYYRTVIGIDGLFLYNQGSYIIKPKRVGYLGTTPETYLHIKFDENDIAYECFEEMAKGA